MAMTDADVLGRLVAINTGRKQRQKTELGNQTDIRVVVGFAGKRIQTTPIGGGPVSTMPAFAHVAAEIGDEVGVMRFGPRWVVVGNLSGRVPVE